MHPYHPIEDMATSHTFSSIRRGLRPAGTLVPVPCRSLCASKTSRRVRVHVLRPLQAFLDIDLKRVKLPVALKTALARVADPGADARAQAAKQDLNEWYSHLDRETAERMLHQDFALYEAGHERKFGRRDYVSLMYDVILPAIPDFQWGHASNYEVDRDGYVLVTVQACGHHTGKPFSLPGLPPIPASGRHFCLEEEAQMVRVENGQVKEIKVFPVRGAGPLALYEALGGEVPQHHLIRALGAEQDIPLP